MSFPQKRTRLPMLTVVALFAVSMALLSGSGLGKARRKRRNEIPLQRHREFVPVS